MLLSLVGRNVFLFCCPKMHSRLKKVVVCLSVATSKHINRICSSFEFCRSLERTVGATDTRRVRASTSSAPDGLVAARVPKRFPTAGCSSSSTVSRPYGRLHCWLRQVGLCAMSFSSSRRKSRGSCRKRAANGAQIARSVSSGLSTTNSTFSLAA